MTRETPPRIATRLAILVLLTLVVRPAWGSCGLDQCPIDAVPVAQKQQAFSLQSRWRFTVPTAAEGWYAESFVGAAVHLGRVFRANVLVPLVVAEDGEGTYGGLGNSVVSAEGLRPLGEAARVGVGLQLELPTTTAPALGQDHLVVLPYLRGTLRLGSFDTRLRAGWSLTPAGEHHHHSDEGPSFTLNPHSGSELVWRVYGGWQRAVGSGWIRPGLGLDGVQEIYGYQQTVLAGVPSVETGLGGSVLRAEAQLPLSTAQRFAWRAGLSVMVPLGGG